MTNWWRVRDNVVNTFFVLTLSIFTVLIISGLVYQIDLNLMFDQFNVGFSKANLMNEYWHLLNYLINPFSGSLRFIYFVASPTGLQHFADVKLLFMIDIIVLIVSVILKIIFRIKLHFYKNDAIILGLLPIVIGFVASVDFDQFFIMFHQMLFTNDDWLFNPITDPIINVLPEFFFQQLIILFLIVFEVLILIGYLNKKRAKSL